VIFSNRIPERKNFDSDREFPKILVKSLRRGLWSLLGISVEELGDVKEIV
jgi:hypothetical protein